MKKTNNKGFSLVELIVVIAIMAVLVGVLAPQFLKYVESSRRAKDIQLASSMQTAYLADMADGKTIADGAITATNKPTTLAEAPVVSGKLSTCTAFFVTADEAAGTCSVGIGGTTQVYDLTDETDAQTYKDKK